MSGKSIKLSSIRRDDAVTSKEFNVLVDRASTAVDGLDSRVKSQESKLSFRDIGHVKDDSSMPSQEDGFVTFIDRDGDQQIGVIVNGVLRPIITGSIL